MYKQLLDAKYTAPTDYELAVNFHNRKKKNSEFSPSICSATIDIANLYLPDV